MAEILLVEDDLHLREALTEALSQQGYAMEAAANCEEARKLFEKQKPHFAVLDIGLPDGNGFELAQDLFYLKPDLKLLFLTAMATPENRLRGLELGAVDYIAKPFHLKELILRLKNLKATDEPANRVKIGIAEVGFKSYIIKNKIEEKTLGHRECKLLELLYERSPNVVSREEIFERLWPQETDKLPTTRTIDNYIVKLRRYIESDPAKPQVLHSVWGVGYYIKKDTP